MTYRERFYPEVKFGGFTDIDGTIAFFTRVNALVDPSFTVLDVGCGRGAGTGDGVAVRRDLRVLKGKVARVIGIDVDPVARENAGIDEFHLIDGDTWPVDDGRVDLVICDNVLEHIEDPGKLFSEARRVLRKGDTSVSALPTNGATLGSARGSYRTDTTRR